MFLLVPAYPGCPGSKAVKRSLLLLLLSLQVLFCLPFLGPSAPYTMHFLTRSSSCFCSRCPEFVECRCCVTVYGTSTVNFSLCSMYAVCDSRLLEARQNFTATSLSLLRNHRKRQQLTALLKSLRTIKTLVSQLKLNCDRTK